MRLTKNFRLSPTHILVTALLPIGSLVPLTDVLAACTSIGQTTNCTAAPPNPVTTPIGTGPGYDNATVDVGSGAQLDTTDESAISLGDGGNIVVRSGAVVTTNAEPGSGYGRFWAGTNTIEFGNNTNLTIESGAEVVATGSDTLAETINPNGYGNTITNYGLIRSENTAIIWFQNNGAGPRNVVDNYGVIEKVGGQGNVIGASSDGGLVFHNRVNASIIGSLIFSDGDDDLFFEAGSTVTGNIDGSGGINNLTLSGIAGSSDALAGQLTNFTTLTKDGDGKWAITGSVVGTTLVTVEDGTLALTGNNQDFDGEVIIRSAGTLKARAQSLPTQLNSADNVGNIHNDGLLRFAQPDDASYIGQIVGNGAVEKTGLGVLILAPIAAAGNTYSGGTSINEGTLAISADNALGAATGGLIFNGGTLEMDAAFDLSSTRAVTLGVQGGTIDTQGFSTTLESVIDGPGGLTKAGGGTLRLTGESSYAGVTHVAAGTLSAGAENVLSKASSFSVDSAATLALNNFSQTISGLKNAGVVSLGTSTGTRLRIAGNYASDNGVVVLNTSLGGDDSATDQMIIGGDSGGATLLTVNNTGGIGARTVEGIKLVEVTGTSAGTFHLVGDYNFQGSPALVAGTYAYRLYQGGASTPDDGDWYLRSSLLDEPSTSPGNGSRPLYQPGVPTYEAYPQQLLSLNGVPTLQQRVGNRYWSGAGAQQEQDVNLLQLGIDSLHPQEGGWSRIEASHSRIAPRETDSSTKYNTDGSRFQAGLDKLVLENTKGTLVAGLVGNYMHGSSNTRSIYGNGEISSDGYGFGGTLTWYSNDGVYVDGQAQFTWFDSDLKSNEIGDSLKNGSKGFGQTYSIESGKRFQINDAWSLTPQAQITYSKVSFDSFEDVFGSQVNLDRGRSLQGRIGGSIDHQVSALDSRGHVDRRYLYGFANVSREFLKGTQVDVSDVSFKNRNEPTWAGVGVGGSYNWKDDQYSLYAEAGIDTSVTGSINDNKFVKGTIGVRIKW